MATDLAVNQNHQRTKILFLSCLYLTLCCTGESLLSYNLLKEHDLLSKPKVNYKTTQPNLNLKSSWVRHEDDFAQPTAPTHRNSMILRTLVPPLYAHRTHKINLLAGTALRAGRHKQKSRKSYYGQNFHLMEKS